jgi:hypothetical protein
MNSSKPERSDLVDENDEMEEIESTKSIDPEKLDFGTNPSKRAFLVSQVNEMLVDYMESKEQVIALDVIQFLSRFTFVIILLLVSSWYCA